MKLVFATHNQNKLKELKKMLPSCVEILSLTDIGCNDEIPETANTLKENASIKSKYINQKYKINCFSDDTGLEVEALDNAPGVYSARYAGEHHNANDNIEKLLSKMQFIENRKARFRTIISLILDGKEYSFEGICNGAITHKKCGKKGFGYDPIFKPQGMDKTFAQMNTKEKGKISHRGKAIEQLLYFLSECK